MKSSALSFILFLLFVHGPAWGQTPLMPALDDLESKDNLSLDEGQQALTQLDAWYKTAKPKWPDPSETKFCVLRNSIFISMQLSRLKSEIQQKREDLSKNKPSWIMEEDVAALKMDENEVKVFSFIKNGILAPDYPCFLVISGLDDLSAHLDQIIELNKGAKNKEISEELHQVMLAMNQVGTVKVASKVSQAEGSMMQLDLPASFRGELFPKRQKNVKALSHLESSEQENSDFLKKLGIEKTEDSHPKCNDLSEFYPKPAFQGNTKACSAYAITSDMAFEMNKNRVDSDRMSFDAKIAYSRIQESLNSGTEKKENTDHGVKKFSAALNVLKSLPLFGLPPTACRGANGLPVPSATDVPQKAHKILGYASLTPTPGKSHLDIDLNFIKTLIDHKKPPMVVVDTDTCKYSEGWMYLMGGKMKHAVVIAGYCEGVDPIDLKNKPYLIIRNSMLDQPVHYRVDANEFIKHIDELHKITAME